ncbi:PAS domain S-box protein [Mucilaginibacter sp. AW1-3]
MQNPLPSIEKLKELQEKLARYEQRELELEEREARLQMAMDSTSLGTWDYHPLEGVLTWSDKCRNIYGAPDDMKINMQVFAAHIYPEDHDFVNREVEKAMDPTGNGDYDATYRITRFDNGSVRWIRAKGKVHFNNKSQAERFIGTVIDITDAKIAEEKNAKLAAIVDSSDDAIVSKTLEGIITSWNQSAERTFGYEAEEMIGQSILKIIPPDRQHEEVEILSRLARGERVEHFETRRLKKNGELIDVSLTISPMRDSKDNIIGLSKIARDITEKKQEEIRKNDFIAMVSHELKTPLTSLRSYIQVLLLKSKGEEDPFRTNALTRADIQTKKMTAMIQDFLSLAKLEEGKIEINKTRFSLDALIEEIAGDAQYFTSLHTIKTSHCAGVMVNADQDKIGQVLMNLVSNAIKYSPKGGEILVTCEKNNDIVEVSVIDNGIGIKAADQENLFQRFYRVKNEEIKTISGFGIGLYLVSEILRYHDSTINVESKEGVGSKFSFKLKIQ